MIQPNLVPDFQSKREESKCVSFPSLEIKSLFTTMSSTKSLNLQVKQTQDWIEKN